MSSLFKSAASLGFHGDDLDPAELTARLGVEPTVGARKGGIWLTRRGAEKVARFGFWRKEAAESEPANLDGQINWLLDDLADDLPAWRDLAARYRGRVFCGLFLACGNEGLTLKPETLVRIGERGLRLGLDIYGAEQPI